MQVVRGNRGGGFGEPHDVLPFLGAVLWNRHCQHLRDRHPDAVAHLRETINHALRVRGVVTAGLAGFIGFAAAASVERRVHHVPAPAVRDVP